MQVTGSEECGGGGRFHRVGKGQKIRISLGDNFEESLKIFIVRCLCIRERKKREEAFGAPT